jgi:hypothetical protein
VTVPAKLTLVRVTVDVEEDPANIVMEFGFADMSIRDPEAEPTLTDTVVFRDIPPAVPVTFTLYVPDVVPLGADTVSIDLGILKKKLGAVKEIDVMSKLAAGGGPAGPETDVERFTIPLKPFRAPTLIVAEPELPTGTLRELSARAR